MKVDGLGIVLAIILLPIIIVVTYYIQLQVDTIAMENSYNAKLLGATYDAMSAFEINTANEELSSVADSMRSIVLASNNIFLNTLATNLGISNANKELLQPYIPAVLYTMYDGYYIYAPTEKLEVAEDVEVGDDGLIKTKEYLSVGDKKVTGTGTKYEYSIDGEGKAVENNDSAINDGDYYGDILYKEEYKDTDPDKYKYEKNKTYRFTSNPDEAQKNADYVLKSYVQYSARYKRDNPKKIDVTINYTLDNYLNIIGTIDDVYYTKTGYLIKRGLVKRAEINENNYDLNNNENDAKDEILGVKTNANETTIDAKNSLVELEDGTKIISKFSDINNDGIKEIIGELTGEEIRTISEAETYLEMFYKKYETEKNEDGTNNSNYHDVNYLTKIQNLEYEIQNCKAVAYYISSACFSNWVYEYLGDLTYGDIEEQEEIKDYYINSYQSSSGVNDLYYDFDESNQTPIFKKENASEFEDPEDTESNFNTHKREVIKNSIKYNLNLAMSAYHNKYTSYEPSLPVLLDEEWDKILSNISIVSFMQGWDCGLNIYNNYEIVSSTNNELTVTPSEIYYVKKDEFNNKEGTYHRIDCPYLEEEGEYISFKSKEVKYDKVYDKSSGGYQFDHKNLACYTCINTNNYNGLFAPKESDFYTGDRKYTAYYDRINSLKKNSSSFGDATDKKKAGYIGLAKERQEIYKTNALSVSEGYEIIYTNMNDVSINNGGDITVKKCTANKIKSLQITFSDTKSTIVSGSRESVFLLNIEAGGKSFSNQALNLDQEEEQTINLDVSDVSNDIKTIKFTKGNLPSYDVEYKIKSIKAIYK